MHSASGRRSHSTTVNLREPQSPGTPARPGSPQETNTRAVVVGTALDSRNSGMTVKAATLSGAQMHGDRTRYAMLSVPDIVGVPELDVCQHYSDPLEPNCPDQDDTSVRFVIAVPVLATPDHLRVQCDCEDPSGSCSAAHSHSSRQISSMSKRLARPRLSPRMNSNAGKSSRCGRSPRVRC